VPSVPSVESTVAQLCFPRGEPGGVVTAGATESTLLGLLIAMRDAAGAPVQVITTHGGRPAVARVIGQLGLPAPLVLDSFDTLPEVLGRVATATAVVATVGTADTGAIDPLQAVAKACRLRGTWMHVDAAEAGVALFSDRLRPLLAGVDMADSVGVEFPGAGVLAVRSAESLTQVRPPAHPGISADPRQLGAELADRCDLAVDVAAEISARSRLRLLQPPVLSTVVFRPALAGDDVVADLAQRTGLALVRAQGADWLKLVVSDRAEHLRLLELCSLSAMSTHSE
jgi:L-2,4-diaminobutyrate decarboxylase